MSFSQTITDVINLAAMAYRNNTTTDRSIWEGHQKWTPIIGQRYKCIPLFHAAILVALS